MHLHLEVAVVLVEAMAAAMVVGIKAVEKADTEEKEAKEALAVREVVKVALVVEG